MLIVVRSPLARLGLDPGAWPAEASRLLHQVMQRPQRCQWIVPTKRRRRALHHEWILRTESSACLLPGLHTLETFVRQSLEYSPRQRQFVGGPERLLRLARVWQEVQGQGAGPGLVNHLSRFVRDWQACNLVLPAKSRDPFERVVHRYLIDLDQDQRLDRMSGVVALTEEIRDVNSWPNRLFFRNLDAAIFDGFHRLEVVELELIAALSQRCPVLVWLVGTRGTGAWQTVETAGAFLKERGQDTRLIDHTPRSTSLFADLGRSLFPLDDGEVVRKTDAVPGVVELAAESQRAEVEAVARRIKADYRQARATGDSLRLSDIAVVIPGPAYDPLVREVFPRAGLEFNLAGRALLVSSARPARVLDAALQLIRSQWRHERLVDFLNLQLVRRRLVDAHRLSYLFEHRPRSKRRLDQRSWLEFWKQHLDRLADRVAGWQTGQPLPDGTTLTREQLVERQGELHASARRLLASIEAVLQPVGDLEATLQGAAAEMPMQPLVDGCVRLLETLAIEKWLTPPPVAVVKNNEGWPGLRNTSGPATQPRGEPETADNAAFNLEGVAVPWVEYEKDQQAYYKLLSILKSLREMPAARLPQAQGRLDALAALHLALSGETYQIRTEDDAGVQLFELREIRGLCFRYVYMLGLVDGQVPAVPEEGILAQRRLQNPALKAQLAQKEAEADYLFTQLFEAAEDRLVLSRPSCETDRQTLPSRYLTAVQERAQLPPLEQAPLIDSARLLAVHVARGGVAETAVSAEADFLRTRLAEWQARPGWPTQPRVESPFLLALLYHETHAFSPSELETYAACPFRYFGTYLLRLEEREPDQTRLHYGSLIHRVLQALYVEMRQAFSGPADGPLPAVKDRQRQRLLQLFEQEWQQLDDGSIPPDLRRLFSHPQGVLQLFLEAMALLEAEHGNYLNEFVLQDEERRPVLMGHDSKQQAVYVTGKIDRVDVHRETATTGLVLDYKTGRAPGPTELRRKIEDGRMLQLPLYAAALTKLRPGLEVIGGAYVHVSEREREARRALAAVGDWLPKKDKRWLVPFEVGQAVTKTLELIERMRGGDFALTDHPVGAKHPECTAYCPMRHACRQPKGYQ